jgi:hypothetical protein
VTKSKNHNSIVFLTTLGVYLGLVLAGGASPQVFAHSALTRNFDIQDEVEVKDDLDKKPDDERSALPLSVQVYLEDVEQFLITLQDLSRKGRFDLNLDAFEVAQASSLPCVAGNSVGSYTAEKFENRNTALNPALRRFSKQLVYGYSLFDCLPSTRFKDKESADSHFDFKLNDSGFALEVVVKKSSPQSAHLLLGPLGQTFQSFKTTDTVAIRNKIIENTTFRSENDQVFVVTYMPRASLEELVSARSR